MKKKIIIIFSIFLPIIVIGTYVFIEKNKQHDYENNLKKLDLDIVTILKDTTSLTFKYLESENLNKSNSSYGLKK